MNAPITSTAVITLPGVFVVGTDTEVGKTVIAAAIAESFRFGGKRVGVLKPVATGCDPRNGDLVSADAEFLATASGTRQPLHLICPNRYVEPVAPSVAARLERRPFDDSAVARSIESAGEVDAWVIEGAGGVLTPIDERRTVRDLVTMCGLPAVLVATVRLGSINHTLMSIEALRSKGVRVAGVILNRYPSGTPSIAERSAADEIERLGRVSILATVLEEAVTPPRVPPGILSAIGKVDWLQALRAAT